MAELLKWAHATVTTCHSKTKNIEKIVGEADILVVGIGSPQFVPGKWIKPGAVVIDCGINSIDDNTKKSGYRLVGDVEYAQAVERAGYITPVPGGVGPMTVALLMANTVLSARRSWQHAVSATWNLRYMGLKPLAKVRTKV
jgi:methylenetetrahydrofolate dehydrogenase (NADP+)/methenyltetrahydrofolate cyclohydrolase/formyltetrahydrofolate synthetase